MKRLISILFLGVLGCEVKLNAQVVDCCFVGVHITSSRTELRRQAKNFASSELLASTVSLSADVHVYLKAHDGAASTITERISIASAVVLGQASLAYTITLPSSYIISRDGSFVEGWLHVQPSGPEFIIGLNHMQTISVDATINMTNSSSGSYSNTSPIPVTINYN